MKKKLLLIMIVLIALISIVLIKQQPNSFHGKIVYSRINKYNELEEETVISEIDGSETTKRYYTWPQLFLIDYDNNAFQEIGETHNISKFSRDGKKLVVQMYYDTLSILDMENISDRSNHRYNDPYDPIEEAEIDIPSQCFMEGERAVTIRSISWNYDDTKLAFVCDIENNETIACILDIGSEKSECWQGEKSILALDWSPINEQLLITYSAKFEMYIRDTKINEEEFLLDGSYGVFSPDGKQIVYKENFDEIKIYDFKKNQSTTLYLRPDSSYRTEFLVFSSDPHFSWSPNGKNIVFNAKSGNSRYFDIFIIEIKSGEITRISSFNFDYRKNFNPTWGK